MERPPDADGNRQPADRQPDREPTHIDPPCHPVPIKDQAFPGLATPCSVGFHEVYERYAQHGKAGHRDKGDE
jgi:hypothetical protein